MVKKRTDKGHRGDASQFFIAGELCRRELVAVVTLGNCPNTDILCSNAEGTRFAHIQVKTFVPGTRTCSVGMKAQRHYGPNFFWVLGGIPLPASDRAFQYYVIPSKAMSKNVQESFEIWAGTAGKKGQARDRDSSLRTVVLPPGRCMNEWDLAKYEGRWDLIERHVNR